MEMQIVRAKKMEGVFGATDFPPDNGGQPLIGVPMPPPEKANPWRNVSEIDSSHTLNGWPLYETSGTGPTSQPYEPGGGLIVSEGSFDTERDESFVGKLVDDPSDDPVRHVFGGATMLNMTKDFSATDGFAPFDLSGPEVDVQYAGLLVLAADSGRVLMLQRSLTENDAAAGKWEIPGGHLEAGESALEGAMREWREEVGTPVPPVKIVGRWYANGYMGFLALCRHETDVPLYDRALVNPEDPDHDNPEAVAWFWPADVVSMPNVRREARDLTPWARIVTRTVIPG
jgi:8-oxo-dGTP pyrophosphatase MutT (NUDIX family)